ncbi:MAG: SAM-dependent methyltransferase [Acidimicrobiales bacterium]
MEREDWDRRYEGEELVWRAEPNRFLVEQVAGLEPKWALDVACGEGRNAVWLAQQGWHTRGVDFSPVALDKARKLAAGRRVEDRVEWQVADVRDEDWDPTEERGSFDLVIVFYLQLGAEMRRRANRAAGLAVAPGGTLLVVAHDLENLTAGVGGPQDPTVLSRSADVVDDLAGTGLTVVRANQVRRPVATDGGTADALDLLVRAIRDE